MHSFDDIRSIISFLEKEDSSLDPDKETRQVLAKLLERIFEAENEQGIGDKLVEIKNTIINELKQDTTLRDEAKAEAKNELKTEELKTEAKNELKTEELKAEAKNELKTEELKTEAKNELKTEELKAEAKNELKADQALRNEVKNGLGGEIKQKVSKFEDLEKAKKELENKLLEKNEADEREKQALEEQLRKKGEELEAKNKTTEQPKQSNAALYTATAGMGLAAGLIAFTALERTVRLEMLVMIGIAVTSALVVGGITYAALPSTQVDGAKAQEVNENGKKK